MTKKIFGIGAAAGACRVYLVGQDVRSWIEPQISVRKGEGTREGTALPNYSDSRDFVELE